jgi:hypothetical protein
LRAPFQGLRMQFRTALRRRTHEHAQGHPEQILAMNVCLGVERGQPDIVIGWVGYERTP